MDLVRRILREIGELLKAVGDLVDEFLLIDGDP
jgi:hypothetical protein